MERKKRRLTRIPREVRPTPIEFSEKQSALTGIGNQTKTAHMDGMSQRFSNIKKFLMTILYTTNRYSWLFVRLKSIDQLPWKESPCRSVDRYTITVLYHLFQNADFRIIIYIIYYFRAESLNTKHRKHVLIYHHASSLFRRFIRIVVDTTEPTSNRHQYSLRRIWPFEIFINKFLLSSASFILARFCNLFVE